MSTKDWLEKDYYKVLGVSKNAGADDIKRAFRKIARDNHPDTNPGDKAAEARFKEASEANAVLSDAEQRKEYDEARSLFGSGVRFGRHPGGGANPGANGFDDLFRNAGGANSGGFGDLFGNLFSGGAAQQRRTATTRGPRRGANIEGEVRITFEQAVEGATVGMRTISDQPCASCRGTGAKAGTLPRVCPACEGSGMTSSTSGGVFSMSEPCRDCLGRGLIVDEPCPDCAGSGRAQSAKMMNVRIPAGVADAQQIRIKGKGAAGENGGANGDLLVSVRVTPHKLFGRSGSNLTLDVPVTFAEATLGAEISIPTLNGARVKLRVPAGTPNGRTLRIRGKGAPKKNGAPGDLLVTLEVQVPDTLSDEAKAALVEYSSKASQGNPRDQLFAG
ncbi:MAG: molecular chaperone DnaJ [Arachnia sp.]